MPASIKWAVAAHYLLQQTKHDFGTKNFHLISACLVALSSSSIVSSNELEETQGCIASPWRARVVSTGKPSKTVLHRHYRRWGDISTLQSGFSFFWARFSRRQCIFSCHRWTMENFTTYKSIGTKPVPFGVFWRYFPRRLSFAYVTGCRSGSISTDDTSKHVLPCHAMPWKLIWCETNDMLLICKTRRDERLEQKSRLFYLLDWVHQRSVSSFYASNIGLLCSVVL